MQLFLKKFPFCYFYIFLVVSMPQVIEQSLFLLVIIVLIPAVLALHKGVITVAVLTSPDCLAGFVNSNISLLIPNSFYMREI